MFEVRITDSTDNPHTLDKQETVKEALTGETLTLTSVGGSISLIESYDPEDDSVISGNTFTATAPGSYRLRVTATQGVRQVLVRVVDQSVLDAIPAPGFVTGNGHSAAPRLVLRSLVNHEPNWRGTAAEFQTLNLAKHGAYIAHH